MTLTLGFEERRVLGTLIEKAFTTPQQCPLTLNSLVNGCNQKSCREPVTFFDEETVYRTLESLRAKGLAILVRSGGGQVDRWKQQAADALDLSPGETAAVAELLLRGGQTDGELRQRASRMVSIENLDAMRAIIESLSSRSEPLVTRPSPSGRKRGVKYEHRLYPDGEQRAVEEIDGEPERVSPARTPPAAPAAPPAAPAAAATDDRRVTELEEEVASLRATISRLAERVALIEAQAETD